MLTADCLLEKLPFCPATFSLLNNAHALNVVAPGRHAKCLLNNVHAHGDLDPGLHATLATPTCCRPLAFSATILLLPTVTHQILFC